MPNLISTTNIDKDTVEKILSRSEEMEKEFKGGKVKPLLEGKTVASIFFEPSTRTRLSFETAAHKLGAKVISAENAAANSSAYKGESIEDTTKMLSSYADVIVMRHPKAGSLEAVAKISTKPVVSAGDGAAEHPTQGLLDLYTIKKECGRLEGLTVAFTGDLLYSRTLRSLLPLLALYKNNKFIFSSPKELELPREYVAKLKNQGIEFEENNDLKEGLPKADVLYMTRVQKERFANIKDYERVKDSFILKVEHLKDLNKKAIIMHPLPRVNEIEAGVDDDPRVAYFRQAENGIYARMAVLLYALGL